jgi:hypothetical protein
LAAKSLFSITIFTNNDKKKLCLLHGIFARDLMRLFEIVLFADSVVCDEVFKVLIVEEPPILG